MQNCEKETNRRTVRSTDDVSPTWHTMGLKGQVGHTSPRRARGRPRKQYLPDISHPLYFAGCSACAGLSYQHWKGCLRFRQNVNADPEVATRVGLTQEQVQMSRDRGLLDQPRVAETPGTASGAVRAPTEAVSGTASATAVSGTAGSEQATASGVVGSGVASGPKGRD
eukprot:2223791-Amphidinium_carterae.3